MFVVLRQLHPLHTELPRLITESRPGDEGLSDPLARRLIVEGLEVDSSVSLVGLDIYMPSVLKRFAGRELDTLDRDGIWCGAVRPSGNCRAARDRDQSRDTQSNEQFLHQFLLINSGNIQRHGENQG